MPHSLAVIGVPSSAGAYAPGQERAPSALRAAGLLDELRAAGVELDDYGDVPGFRWRVDREQPRAMNSAAVAAAASSTARLVAKALATDAVVLVLGGDCTVELGTVAGALESTTRLGLVYVDLDTDLNTPASTTDGALDWMGVAHLLALPETDPTLLALSPRRPMLTPEQITYFGVDNIEPYERDVIASRGIQVIGLHEVRADPEAAAAKVVSWSRQFEKLLVHVDLDVLDYLDMPLAENTRRNWGLRFDELIAALGVLLQAPNWSTLTICELNPDHGAADGSTVRMFVRELTRTMASASRLRGSM